MIAEESHATLISTHPSKLRHQPVTPHRAMRKHAGLASLRAVLGSLLVTFQGAQTRMISSADAVAARTRRLAPEVNQQRF